MVGAAAALLVASRQQTTSPADAAASAAAIDALVDEGLALARKANALTGAVAVTGVLAASAFIQSASPEPPCRPRRDPPAVSQPAQPTSPATNVRGVASEMPDPKFKDSTKVVTEDKDPCNPQARGGGR